MFQLRRVIFSGVLVLSFLCGWSFANILPESSYSSDWEGSVFSDWEGNTYYGDNDDAAMRIDFAVYDTQDLLADSGEEELSGLFGATDKRYIYAYQILTKVDTITAVASFAIRDGDGQAVDEDLISDIGAVDPAPFDSMGLGLEPDDILASGEWGFDGFSLKDTERSWFLMFASDSAPTMGSYEVTAAEGISIPGEGEQSAQATPTPEPVSILLLGSGFLAVRRRRKSVKV